MARFAVLVCLCVGLLASGRAMAFGDGYLMVCNRGNTDAFVVTYSANPIFANGTVEAWFRARPGGRCASMPMNSMRTLSVGIIANGPDGKIVPLKYAVRARGRMSGSVRSICVPTRRGRIHHAASPSRVSGTCRSGEVSVPTSFAVRGGSNDIRVNINVNRQDVAAAHRLFYPPVAAPVTVPTPAPAPKPAPQVARPQPKLDIKGFLERRRQATTPPISGGLLPMRPRGELSPLQETLRNQNAIASYQKRITELQEEIRSLKASCPQTRVSLLYRPTGCANAAERLEALEKKLNTQMSLLRFQDMRNRMGNGI